MITLHQYKGVPVGILEHPEGLNMHRIHISALFIGISLLAGFPGGMNAQTESAPPDSMVRVVLTDGSTLEGTLIQENIATLTIRTRNNLEIKIQRSEVRSITHIKRSSGTGLYAWADPNYSRLLFAPTGRPLKRGDGYFSDYYIFFPGVAYGITDNLSLMGGFSIIPGLGLGDQLIYLAPRIGKSISDQLALSGGTLFLSLPEIGAAGLLFATGTYGPPEKSLTGGIAFGYAIGDEDAAISGNPVIMLGGNIRLSDHLAFISENWIITGGDLSLSTQPFSVALRFFGDRLAADVGFLIIGEIVKEGFPIPWLSAVYNFGR